MKPFLFLYMNRIARICPNYALCLLLMIVNQVQAASQSIQGSFVSKFRLFEKQEAYTGSINTELHDVAWKGERLVNQLMLWTSSEQTYDLDYQLTDLTGDRDTISATHMNLKFVTYILADRESRPCSEYTQRDGGFFDEIGDALTQAPVTNLSLTDPIRIWLTINIPADIDSGNYKGCLVVRTAGETALSFKISLNITEWQIPDPDDWGFQLDLWQYPTRVIDRYNDAHMENKITYWSGMHFGLLKRMYSILADKGQKIITAHIKEGALGCSSMIRWERSAEGNWTYDFSVFDQYIDSMMNWGFDEQISCHSPVGWNPDEIPYWDGGLMAHGLLKAPIGSPEFAERWDDFLTHFKLHLESKGWFEKAILFMDEIPEEQMKSVIAVIKHNSLAWKIGLAGFHPLSNDFLKDIYYLSLMYEVPFGIIDKNRINTFYFSCNPPFPNNFVATDANVAGNTLIGWYAHSKNLTGFLRWAYDNWVEGNPMEMRIGAHTSGDFALIYRSSNQPDMEILSSIRLELMRDGIQDFEKLSALKDQLAQSSKPNDLYALTLLYEKLDSFKYEIVDPKDISKLVQSGQQLIRDIIAGYVSENNPTAILEKNMKENYTLNVYLDSSTHTLQVGIPDNMTIHDIRIVDLSGRIVYSRFGINSGKCLVDVNDLKYGLYLLNVNGNRKSYTEKVIIMSSQ